MNYGFGPLGFERFLFHTIRTNYVCITYCVNMRAWAEGQIANAKSSGCLI